MERESNYSQLHSKVYANIKIEGIITNVVGQLGFRQLKPKQTEAIYSIDKLFTTFPTDLHM